MAGTLKYKIENDTELLRRLKLSYEYDITTGRFIRLTNDRQGKAGELAGRISKRGYRELSVASHRYREHRLVWLWLYGELPSKPDGTPAHIEHKDHDRTNNKPDNLRILSNVDNSRNCKLSSNNTTGINGVILKGTFTCGTPKYIAQIKVNYKMIYLGAFSTIQDAELARKHADCIYAFSSTHGERPTDIVEVPPLEFQAQQRIKGLSYKHKSVVAINSLTGILLRTYKSIGEAAKSAGVAHSTMSNRITNKLIINNILYKRNNNAYI